jgi:hypothetical protein
LRARGRRLSRELGYAISLWSHPVMKQVYSRFMLEKKALAVQFVCLIKKGLKE